MNWDFTGGYDLGAGQDVTTYTASKTMPDGTVIMFSCHHKEPESVHPRIRCEIDCIGYANDNMEPTE